jgi:hypothetical protein
MSLIFCQIQHFSHVFWSFWSSLLLPKFSRWQILFAILVQLGLPFCLLDPISSGHEYIKIQLYLLQPSLASTKFFDANKRHEQYRRCHRPRHLQHRDCRRSCGRHWQLKKNLLDRWALIPTPAPNIHQKISTPLLDNFIYLHDPSQLMEFGKIFSDQNKMNHGVVTILLTMVST